MLCNRDLIRNCVIVWKLIHSREFLVFRRKRDKQYNFTPKKPQKHRCLARAQRLNWKSVHTFISIYSNLGQWDDITSLNSLKEEILDLFDQTTRLLPLAIILPGLHVSHLQAIRAEICIHEKSWTKKLLTGNREKTGIFFLQLGIQNGKKIPPILFFAKKSG